MEAILKRKFLPAIAWMGVFGGLAGGSAGADEAYFRKEILPLLAERCNGCHSTEKQKGDLDLERFATVASVKADPHVWEQVLDQLAHDEMPPKKEPQFTTEQEAALTAWVRRTLDEAALARAGDPGPVVLRRLSNMEYTYSLRDLTGVDTLDPAREFPVDGAAGEGFTNAGAGLVMSPGLLTKYLDAAKAVAGHAVLVPSGLRFSASDSPQDWTDETLSRIRDLHVRHSATGGATAVNLQGVKFGTNAGGRLPVERYIAALLAEREALRAGRLSPAAVAAKAGLNPKYLAMLWEALNGEDDAVLMNEVRRRFSEAPADDSSSVVALIAQWQGALWRFTSVGHIGKENGPKAWQEPVTPLAARQEIKLKLAAPADGTDVKLWLATGDAGDGTEGDVVVWENPRLRLPGGPDLPLREAGAAFAAWEAHRAAVVAAAEPCLEAAASVAPGKTLDETAIRALAGRHGVEPRLLGAWLRSLGLSGSGPVPLGPLLTGKMPRSGNYDFIQGWTGPDALSVLANSSATSVRVPGVMAPHGVAAHPSPKLAVVLAWRSPVEGRLRVTGRLSDAHPECGNGVTWALEHRRGTTREVLAEGVSQGAAVVEMGTFENLPVRPGEVLAVVIGPRDGNHSCDLTAVDLTLNDGEREWSLAGDVSPDILAGNPHADRHGNAEVWHFLGETVAGPELSTAIPAGSVLASWRAAPDAGERRRLASELRRLLEASPAGLPVDSPDRALRNQLLSAKSPLLAGGSDAAPPGILNGPHGHGLDPALFGKHPGQGQGSEGLSANDLFVAAPSLLELSLPGWAVDGAEFTATVKLKEGAQGSAQARVLVEKPEGLTGLAADEARAGQAAATWSDGAAAAEHGTPVLAEPGSERWKRFEAAFADFRQLFPQALCYTKIVPVDEVVTLTLYHREDEPLRRLMLDEAEAAELDRLWDELLFVSEAPLKQVDVFDQLWQYATQDAKPSAFEPMREPIRLGAEAYRRRLSEAEPVQVEAVVAFAARAWRRPLSESEGAELRTLYRQLRGQDLAHPAALRLVLARVLVAPAFLYRGEQPGEGQEASPVSDWELATRLSYFLWSSTPDGELLRVAAEGRLRQPEVLAAQARRLLRDPKADRLALEFGCQWLHVRDVETLEEKSERHFPTFAALRGPMQEEAVRFFADLFQQDRSVLSLLDADHTFVNGALASHYGLPPAGDEWRRVEGLRAQGRGGILGFASTLAKQSGASRTSPILRGNWLSEVVLGEKLPRPPKDVPLLPDEAPAGLTERQLIERHSSDARCAGCHRRIDPFGFALEGFDAIGRARRQDAAGQAIETRVTLPDGAAFDGLDGLREYLLTTRRDDFLRQFCRKLLGYALGRAVQLSDRPLLDTMVERLNTGGHRAGLAVEAIVLSPQFREIRGGAHPGP